MNIEQRLAVAEKEIDHLRSGMAVLTGALMLAINHELSVTNLESARERLLADLLATNTSDARIHGIHQQIDALLAYFVKYRGGQKP